MAVMKDLLSVLIVSMTPVMELRASIPLGVALEMDIYTALIISILGNIFPSFFLIPLTGKVFDLLKGKSKFIDNFISKLEKKAESKFHIIEKYKKIGLIILIAIPLPGTGVWTGCLVASMLNMKLKDSVVPVILGTIIAAIIVTSITYGVTIFF